jgi:hypothetical protein
MIKKEIHEKIELELYHKKLKKDVRLMSIIFASMMGVSLLITI